MTARFNGSIDKISELTVRATEVAGELDTLYAERRALALAAAAGDVKASGRIKQIDAEALDLLAMQATLAQAAEAAGREREEKIAATQREEKREHAHRIRTLDSAIVGVAGEIDLKLKQVREALDRYTNMSAERNRIAPSSAASMLTRKFVMNAAFHAAQLHKYAVIEHVAPGHVKSLFEIAASALKINNNSDKGDAAA